jgi:hypothetical protein
MGKVLKGPPDGARLVPDGNTNRSCLAYFDIRVAFALQRLQDIDYAPHGFAPDFFTNFIQPLLQPDLLLGLQAGFFFFFALRKKSVSRSLGFWMAGWCEGSLGSRG